MKVLLLAATLLLPGAGSHAASAAGGPQACTRDGGLQRTGFRPDETPLPCCRDAAGCARLLSTRTLVHQGHGHRI